MDQEKGYGDYKQRLESLTADEYFLSQDQKKKGLLIAGFRDEYLASMPDADEQTTKTISDLSKIKSDYVKSDRYRVEADDFIKAGLEYPSIAGQPKEKALENIDLFRKQIDERSVYFDPVFRDDYVYDLKRLADEEERAVRGEGVGRAQDLHNRYVKGWTGSLLRGVGMTETADKLDLEFFPVNPEYDADFISKLSTGGGDMVATMGIVFGATAVGGPWAGGAAGLATNATRKYQDAYKQEFDASGNAELAHQAGLASTPGAALETAGEMLIAGRFAKLLPKGFRQEFLNAPNAAARSEVVRKALAETSTRAKLGAIAFNSVQEGTSEVTGDFVSGLGSAAVTGRESFVPTGAEAAETFAISALLGGAMGGVEAGFRRPDAALRGEQQAAIKDMLDKGDYQGVSSLVSQRIIETAKPDKNTPTVPEKPQAKPAMTKAEQAVENGEVANAVINDRGERIKVDERTAKIHDSLIDSLTRLSGVDDLNALPAGKAKGQRSNIKTNNDRAIELEAIKAQEEQLNIELPERARLFAEIDKVGEEAVNMDPDKASMVKRVIDSIALTTIQYGMDPNTVYQGMSYRVDQTTEQAKAVARRGKVRSIQETFNRESEQLGLDPASNQVTITESDGELDQESLSDSKRLEMTASMQLRDSDIFSEEDTGAYHFGDGGIGRDTTFRRIGGGRGTGHFGTGVYFLGNKEDALARANRQSRNIDVSRLNMAKPSVPRTLHDSLRLINKFVYDGKRPEFDQPSSEGSKALFGVNIELGLSRHSEADIQKAIEETYDLFERGENDGVRTPSTYFMQALGYDGIDVRGTDLDNGDYGSVVFSKGIDRNSISSQDELFQYAGRRASITPNQLFNRNIARQMLEDGRSADEIRLATGWFPGKYDGKLRWEIDDSAASLTDAFYSLEESKPFKDVNQRLLSEVLSHDELFSAYPELADVKVIRRRGLFDIFGSLQGSFDSKTNTLNVTPNAVDPISTMLHEIQHWIQVKEGFARGGNEQSSIDALSDKQKEDIIDVIRQKSTELIAEINKKADKANESIKLIDKIDPDKFSDAISKLRSAYSRWETAFQLRDDDMKNSAAKQLSEAKDDVHRVLTDEKYISDSEFLGLYATAVSNKKVSSIDSLRSEMKAQVARLAIEAQDAKAVAENISGTESLKKALKKFGLGHELYTKLAGEIEARDTQARKDLNKDQRSQTSPYSSEDISVDDALVTFDDPGVSSSQLNNELFQDDQQSRLDADYFAAIESGDMETVKRIVEEVARKAGFRYRVYHGTNDDFDSFDPDKYLTDRDQLSGPGINTTNLKEEAASYGRRVIEAFAKSENPGRIRYNVFELLSSKEREEADSALEESVTVITRRLLDASIEPYGSTFVIKSKSRTDLGFLDNPPFEGRVDSRERALQLFDIIANGSVSSLHHSITPNEEGISSYGAMNRKIIEILKGKGYDSIVMEVREDDKVHAKGAEHRILFDPNQIKSADPITYDDQGNIIPPSQRFNTESDSILYQKTVQDLWRNLTPAKNAPRTLQVGNSLQSAKQVVEQFLAKNPTVTSKNGRTVQLHHAKQGSIDILVQHLSTREDGSFDARRAMHTGRIPHTLQNAEILATDEKTKNTLYLARYRDKSPGRPGQKSREFDNVHVVLVKPDNTLVSHGEISEDVWTQFVRDFADGPATKQGLMPAELLQMMGLADGSLEAPSRSGGDMSAQSLDPTTPKGVTVADSNGFTMEEGITEQPSTTNTVSPAPSTLTGATDFSVEIDPNSKLSQSQGENFIKVLFGGQPTKPKGRIQFQNEDGTIAPLYVPIEQLDNKLRSIITISRTSGDVSTFMHETIHYLHRSGVLTNLLSGQELEAFEQAAGLGADRIWRVENYEAVARGFEGWLRNPKVRFESTVRVPAILERVFNKLASAMLNIYKSLRDSGLPFKDEGNRAVPNIHPDFRVAFERLFSFDPSLRLGQLDIKSPAAAQPNNTAQNASQLPSVNRQLTGEGRVESPQRTAKKATDEQLSGKDSEPDKYPTTSNDRLNIKLVKGMKAKHRLDNAVVAAFNSVIELSAGLHLDKDLSGLFYSILDNFATSRRLNKSAKREQQLREPFAPNADEGKYSIGIFDAIKNPGDPAYSKQVINRLNQIRDEAFKLWFDQYKARNPDTLGEFSVDDIDPATGERKFSSKLDVIKFNAENKEAKAAADAEETSDRRQSINDNVNVAQLAFRVREPETLPGYDLPGRFDPLKATIERYYEFLKAVDVNTEEMSDRDAFRIQLYLDALLNDDVLLGLDDFAKHEMRAKLGEATGLEKYRAPYSRFGLVGILARFGRDISETVTGLRLTSINIEAVARTDAARRFLNNVLMDGLYDATSKGQVLKNEYKEFLKATKEKHFGKYGIDPIQMHTAGIISKIMQAPVDLDADQLLAAIKNNVTQLRQGFTNEAQRGGIAGKHAGQLKIKLLDDILAGLPEDFDQEQFIDHVQEKFPNETGYVMDNVQWIADNLTAGSQMVVEGLWRTQFNPQGYYLPTEQFSLNPVKGDEIELDGSFFKNQYGGDEFKAHNPVTVKRSGSLQARTGFLSDKDYSTYNTNLEYVLEEAVNGIISDIYTGFERKKLGYLLNTSKQTPGSLRAQFEDMLSTDGNDGADAVKHLRKTIHDMVSTDLGQHRYINQLEALTSVIRKNIAPAMLSSLHQPITQTVSAFVSHITRRYELIPYYHHALKLAMDHTLGNAPASFNTMFDRHLSERAPAHDYLLAKGQSIPRTTPLDKLGDYIVGQANIDKKSFVEFRNKAKLFDGKVKDGLLAGLRFGDMFSAKVIFAAELLHAAKQEQGVTDPMKVEYDRIKPETMTQIINVMDEAINASRNSRRGTILAHPGAVLSMLTIFAGHRISVASATGLRIRNTFQLMADKNFSDGMLGDSARYALATVFQSITFSALKWGVMGMLVKGLYQAITPEEDDERHWLYGDMERKEVEDIRKLTEERYESSFGPNTLGTSILRDMFGNVLLTWAFGGVDNFMFTGMDVPLKENFNQGKEEALDQIRKQLQQRASLLSEAEIADLNRQYDAIEKMKYVPMGFKSFGSDDLGGSLGTALQPAMDFTSALNESTFTSKRMSVEDFALVMRLFGYGQPELTRVLKILAKKKDMDAERTEEELNEYDF